MGLFSSIGKVLKGAAKVASFIPGVGGTISKVAGTVGGLLDHKKPMAKPMYPQPNIARGMVATHQRGGLFGTRVLRMTPTMPGGAISTPRGMMAQNGGAVPTSFGGASSAMGKVRRKRKAAPKRRAAAKRTARRSTGRKLKFGSPAWRKKYLKRR